MSDHELLELAAKVACIDMEWHWEAGKAISCINPHPEDEALSEIEVWPEWNPLTDDGDALRLAVAVGLSVSITNYEAGAHTWGGYGSCELYSDHPDRGSATRRAIVRAAAEIGRAGT